MSEIVKGQKYVSKKSGLVYEAVVHETDGDGRGVYRAPASGCYIVLNVCQLKPLVTEAWRNLYEGRAPGLWQKSREDAERYRDVTGLRNAVQHRRCDGTSDIEWCDQ